MLALENLNFYVAQHLQAGRQGGFRFAKFDDRDGPDKYESKNHTQLGRKHKVVNKSAGGDRPKRMRSRLLVGNATRPRY